MIEALNNAQENSTPVLEPTDSEMEKVQAAKTPAALPLEAFFSIPVTVELVLARMKMPVSGLMNFQVGSEVNLDHEAGAEVALVVNGSQLAFGHLFLIDPLKRAVGIRISRLAAPGGVM